MKKEIVVLLAILIAASAIALAYSFTNRGHAVHQVENNMNQGFTVVELFTSEGCSSCPPADAAVATLLSKAPTNLYVLSFHVDYWNRPGWTDAFSQAAFSARQRDYAHAFSLESIYTPQIVVNGKTEFVGSDVRKLHAAVENGLQKRAESNLKINTSKTGNTVTVTYTFSNRHVALLNVALVQPKATTLVKGGENRGKTLRHVNIVRAFRSVEVKENGHLTIEIPAELSTIPLHVIAYAQSSENYTISGADQKMI